MDLIFSYVHNLWNTTYFDITFLMNMLVWKDVSIANDYVIMTDERMDKSSLSICLAVQFLGEML